ncbi:2Fe-2S ferredoxin [Sphingomonas sp. Leaf412]|uniref:2Fe-2S iron-sulfur cluster-binding protein n=1 Tax=Sphingomonas sp. Leaf412 TaxID=1736370 RepID=UPI0006FB5271|nr:2Fe-2S iron-sulfur cluster-binding protein [Sphingomonas sp. Leaf412]KQT32594.1 2Fe-2S ferredoxin [Sphingomonas sp. Leaf412]
MRINADGVAIDARIGETLLDAAQRAGLPLEGTCGGDMACATCHVVIAPDDMARLPGATEEEEDLLDMLPRAVATSRLGCQIRLSADHANLSFALPPGSAKVQRP